MKCSHPTNPSSSARPFTLHVVTALLLVVSASRAKAGQLTPNPPNGTSPATLGDNYVSLIPNPASYRSPAVGCPWLLPAAQVGTAPFNTDPKNPWVFNYAANFNGTFNLTQY